MPVPRLASPRGCGLLVLVGLGLLGGAQIARPVASPPSAAAPAASEAAMPGVFKAAVPGAAADDVPGTGSGFRHRRGLRSAAHHAAHAAAAAASVAATTPTTPTRQLDTDAEATPPSSTTALARFGRLVVHVGPHKTGTSSTQAFLLQHAEWLSGAFVGLKIAAASDKTKPKMGCYVPNFLLHHGGGGGGGGDPSNWRFVSERAYTGITEEIRGWCAQGSTVILSSEDFSGLSLPDWRPVLELCGAVTLVRHALSCSHS